MWLEAKLAGGGLHAPLVPLPSAGMNIVDEAV